MILILVGLMIASDPPADLGDQIVALARSKLGQTVGDGQCTALAFAALRSVGARRLGPRSAGAGWGEERASLADVRPGDILQFDDALIVRRSTRRDGTVLTSTLSFPHHTAIVERVKQRGTRPTLVILHQNVGAPGGGERNQTVQQWTIALTGLRGGTIRAYRPLAEAPRPPTRFTRPAVPPAPASWDWTTASPETQGMSAPALEAAWSALKARHTTALLVVRHDRLVYERYAEGYSRATPHYTASMAKALVGGLGLMIAIGDGRIRPDDPAARYVPRWRDDPTRKAITIRHLATHTSGIEDAESAGVPHARLTGWKGDFWKRRPPPDDPFTIARDLAPVLEPPGTRERYSNPGMAMLGYCLAAALRGTEDPDLRSLLKRRVMRPLGVADAQWSAGYGDATTVDGLRLVATWGGGGYSPDAVARVGRLLLHRGTWEGRELLDPAVVADSLKPSGLPGHSGLGWWVNRGKDGSRLWKSAPVDAFGGAGAGQQLLLVVPSLDLIVVRNGENLDSKLAFDEGLDRHVIGPLIRATSAPTSR